VTDASSRTPSPKEAKGRSPHMDRVSVSRGYTSASVEARMGAVALAFGHRPFPIPA
jgi:hypothetical protein